MKFSMGYNLPDFYKPLDKCSVIESEWNECPNCGLKPRLWIFDNGEYAKCGCNEMYDKASANGISIWTYHDKHNGDMTNWNHNDLRDNWNNVVENRFNKSHKSIDKYHYSKLK